MEVVKNEPVKVYLVTLLLNESLWHDDIKRYVFYKIVGPNKIDVVVTEGNTHNFEVDDLRIATSLLSDERFDSVIVETFNKLDNDN